MLQISGRFGLGLQNEAGQRLTEFCQENALVMANIFQQHKRTSKDGQDRNQTDYVFWQLKMEKLNIVNQSKTRS